MADEIILIEEIVNVITESVDVVVVETAEQGPAGLSAYSLAVKNGYQGTEQQWLSSFPHNSYQHNQTTPATTWTINHNLGRYPSIELLSVGLVKFEADISHTSLNQAIVNLAIATAGIAQCN